MRILLITLLAGLCLLGQDAGMVLGTSVGYRTIRASRSLTDEQKAEADREETLARAATQERKFGEALRHYYHGLAVMNGVAWTPEVASAAGLQMKPDHAIAAPGKTINVILQPLFQAEKAPSEPLTGAVVLRAAKGDAETPLAPASGLGKPIAAAIPASVAAGDYFLELRLSGSTDPKAKSYFVKSVPVRVDDLATAAERVRSRIQSAAGKKAPAIATAEYALTLYDRADRGDVNPHRVDLRQEFSRAEAIADAVIAGRDPFAGQKGDMRKAYRSAVDNELQPYRLFVPDQYDGTRALPVVVALHGMGGDENSMFDAYANGVIKREAARLGYLLVCPKGREKTSMYMGPAEKDVLDVLAEMQRDYRVDASRIYLMGHSMGAYGTWSIAMRNPKLWAALGPISGGGNAEGMAGLKDIPQYVVHGDNDKTVPVTMSRRMVAAGKQAGGKIEYVEVAGGSHSDVVVPQLGPMFDFFSKQKKEVAEAATR